jgi:uncharacterized protein YndB with AHSA1/START domain
MLLPGIYWRTYVRAAPQRVFTTLTTANGWDGWFTDGAELDARVGGKFRLRWRGTPGHRVTLWGPLHESLDVGGPVVAYEPERRFAFEWATAGHPTTVTFELTPLGAGTVVAVSETGYTTDDLGATGVTGAIDGRSPFAMCASGWGEALTLLKFYLEQGLAYGPVPES